MLTLAASSRARLSRDELHQLRWLLGLVLVLLAFWTLLSLELGGLGWRALFLATAAAALLFPGWPGRIPAWLRRWSFILGASALFTQFIATRFDLVSGLVLLVSLLALARGLQYRRLREDWQLILLCLFIIILSGVLTLNLLFGLQILLFTLVTMALLFVMNLLERDPGRALTTEDWRNFRWRHFARKVRGAVDLRQLAQAGALFTGLVLVSTLIFVSMPRFQFSQSFSLPSLHGVAGFHDKIEYAETRSIDSDDSIAFRVDLPPGYHLAHTPYWRMIALDEYRKTGFEVSNSQAFENRRNVIRYPEPGRSGEHLVFPSEAEHIPGAVSIFLEGNVSEYLPILGPFDSLLFNSTQTFMANEKMKTYRTDLPSPKVLGYQVENMEVGDQIPSAPDRIANLTLAKADEVRARASLLPYPYSYFSLPAAAGDREILERIVAQIKAGKPDMPEADFIAATVTYLREHHIGQMDVDLSKARPLLTDAPPPTDLLIRWLDSNSPGWCEHFSGAFVLLCRAAGYPARVVAGYRGAAYNSIDNYYLVRQNYAHAWAEVFDETRKDRWLRVDPSPGAGVIVPGQPTVATSMDITTENGWSAFVDGLRMIWYRRVINFDQTDQQELVAKVSEYGKDFGATAKAWFLEKWQAVMDWYQRPLTPLKAAVLSALIFLFGLAFLLRRRLRNFWLRASARFWPRSARQLAPVRLDAGRWLRIFQPAWEACAPGLPKPAREEWQKVHRDLLILRYGPPDFPADPEGTFRHARQLVRAAKSTPAKA